MGNPHPKTAHLKKYAWKPGQYGGGHRKKGKLGIKSQLKKILSKLDKDGEWSVPVAERLVSIALGDPKKIHEELGIVINTDQILKALKEIQDRTEGKPKETVEQSVSEKVELTFKGFKKGKDADKPQETAESPELPEGEEE